MSFEKDGFNFNNWIKFISVSYFFKIGISFIIIYTFSPTEESLGNQNVDYLNFSDKFLMVIIVAPIFETLFFQFGVIEILTSLFYKWNFRFKDFILILISSSAFSLVHIGSIFNVFHGFLSGLILSSIYTYARLKGLKPFFSTALVHFLFNSTIFIVNEYF